MIELTKTVQISQFNKGVFVEVDDTVTLEYHLTLNINGQRQAAFSCTPQYLEEMLLGHLISEGIVDDLSQVEHLNLSEDGQVADVWIKKKNDYCDEQRKLRLLEDGAVFSLSGIIRQFARFTHESRIHRKAGGVHRAALCNDKDTLLAVNDISRHNTFDKIIGMANKKRIDAASAYIITSGRVPSEIVKKVITCGIPMLVARSVATFEAIELARAYNLTLIGRVGDEQMKIYSGIQRIKN